MFKNLIAYQITGGKDVPIHGDKLVNNAFVECGRQDIARYGWVNPVTLEPEGELFRYIDGSIVLCVKIQERILPSGIITKEAAKEATARGLDWNQLSRKMKQSIKEDVCLRLIPQAFTKDSFIFGYVDYDTDMIIVDASSFNKAEMFTGLLRKSIGSLPVEKFSVEAWVDDELTEWVKSSAPPPFEVLDDVVFKSLLEDGGKVTTKSQPLNEYEIAVITDQRVVTKLALSHNDAMTFTLCDDLSIRRVRLSDTLRDEMEEIDAADKLTRFDADFLLMRGAVRAMYRDLAECLEGK